VTALTQRAMPQLIFLHQLRVLIMLLAFFTTLLKVSVVIIFAFLNLKINLRHQPFETLQKNNQYTYFINYYTSITKKTFSILKIKGKALWILGILVNLLVPRSFKRLFLHSLLVQLFTFLNAKKNFFKNCL